MIDEIEVGLHPKIQRRLMDVLYMISKDEYKQFIITTHSYAILNSVPPVSRIFIENRGGNHIPYPGLSTYEALTRMDSEIFPVVTVYVEDDESKFIVQKAIEELNSTNNGIARLIRVIAVGPANETYDYFKHRELLRDQERISTKAACVLDGDMENKRDSNGDLKYPTQDGLFFHFSNEVPEKMMVRKYLTNNPNDVMTYHVDHSNPHCLLQKMAEEGLAVNKQNALESCFSAYRNSPDGSIHFDGLKQFLLNQIH